MLVNSNECFIAKLGFEVHSESFNSEAHGVAGLHTRQVLQKFRVDTHVWWFLVELVFVTGISFTVIHTLVWIVVA